MLNSSGRFTSVGILAVLMSVLNVPATHAWQFDFLTPAPGVPITIKYGGSVSFQLIADHEVIKVIQPQAGTPLSVRLFWIRPGGGTAPACWPQPNKPCLPSGTLLAGPFPDKSYRSQEFSAAYAAFNESGVWSVKACIEKTSVGCPVFSLTVAPRPAFTPDPGGGSVHQANPTPVPPGNTPAKPNRSAPDMRSAPARGTTPSQR